MKHFALVQTSESRMIALKEGGENKKKVERPMVPYGCDFRIYCQVTPPLEYHIAPDILSASSFPSKPSRIRLDIIL